jgi:hypothetical protein
MDRRNALRRIWLIASILCLPAPALADVILMVPLHRSADVAVGDAKGARKIAFSWGSSLGFIGDHLRLGVGARMGAYFIRPGAALSNEDARLYPPDFHAITLNSFVQGRIRLVAQLEFGANIDVFGYGFGSSVVAVYQLPGSSFRPYQPARVSHLNLLKLGSGDEGQLDSEFFVAYRFGPVGIRAGVTHFAVELITKQPVDYGKSRFRQSFTGGFAALSYCY